MPIFNLTSVQNLIIADDDFEFDGWYKNGKRVSSNEVYTFAVKDNTELEAVFTDITDVSEDYE